ncbi:MAG: hypothetical protein NTZ18_03700 [Candidatus Komeilibacteria bacterium]|nr:hypothetical protein [Candidatus Komeilibacteria bacterium]
MSANKKISELDPITTSEDNDLVVVVDVSANETKKQTKANLLKEVNDKADDHIGDTDNPHQVTAGQVGAYTKGEDDELLSAKANSEDLTNHEGDHDNPHAVTAAQTGAYTSGETDELLNAKANAEDLSGHLTDYNDPHQTLSKIKDNVVPTGAINGINTIFVLPDTPAAGSLKVWADGLRMTPNVDFTLGTATITFITPPMSAVIADYRI